MNQPANRTGWQLWLVAALCAAFAAGPSAAQDRLEEGERIAAGAGPGGAAAACISCHGAHGLGEPGAGIPRLAGLDAIYLAKQMDDYASGARPSPIMKPIAAALDAAERAAVSRYYAAKADQPQIIRHPMSRPDADVARDGAVLWSRGSAARRIQACIACHSNRRDAASAPVYPALAGQPARYVIEQLRQFRDGRRRNDPGGVMRAVAARLGDREIEALAAYVASLPR